MAFAEVGGGSQRALFGAGNVDSVTVAFPANVGNGGLLIGAGGIFRFSSATTSVSATDTRGTSYSSLFGPTGVNWAGGFGREFLVHGVAPSAGPCSMTIDPSGTGNFIDGAIDEFSANLPIALDVDGLESVGFSAAPADTLSTLTANALIVAFGIADVVGVWTAGAGYTKIPTNANNQPNGVEFQIVGAAGPYTADFSIALANWAVHTAAFKEVAGAAPGGGAAAGASSMSQSFGPTCDPALVPWWLKYRFPPRPTCTTCGGLMVRGRLNRWRCPDVYWDQYTGYAEHIYRGARVLPRVTQTTQVGAPPNEYDSQPRADRSAGVRWAQWARWTRMGRRD